MWSLQIFAVVLQLGSLISLALASASSSPKVCTVKANGNQIDDVPNILKAFHTCGNGGKIIFPEGQSYWIATRLNPILKNVDIEWRGEWIVSDLQLWSEFY